MTTLSQIANVTLICGIVVALYLTLPPSGW